MSPSSSSDEIGQGENREEKEERGENEQDEVIMKSNDTEDERIGGEDHNDESKIELVKKGSFDVSDDDASVSSRISFDDIEIDSSERKDKRYHTSATSSISASGENASPALYFCYICYSDRNKQDLDASNDEEFQLSSCHHKFCKSCLKDYLKVSIVDGKTNINCCYVIENKDGLSICNAVISEGDVSSILDNCPEFMDKYNRFKFLKGSSNARECPKCSHLQYFHPSEGVLGDVSNTNQHLDLKKPQSNQMICQNPDCRVEFCFHHALAHPSDISCSDYESSIAASLQASSDMIRSISKSCPNCGILVSKESGCNHMKCSNCQKCFCWLCGKAVEDAIFPNHYQWWNLNGCANMQMAEALEPTFCTRVCARASAIAQTVFLGPITLLTSLCCILSCFPCVFYFYESRRGTNNTASNSTSNEALCEEGNAAMCRQNNSDSNPENSGGFSFCLALQGCMSSWGMIYLFVLVFFPLAVVTAVFVFALWFLSSIFKFLLYPAYYISQKKKGKVPKSIFSYLDIRLSDSPTPSGNRSVPAEEISVDQTKSLDDIEVDEEGGESESSDVSKRYSTRYSAAINFSKVNTEEGTENVKEEV